jgi:hypothetical protein
MNSRFGSPIKRTYAYWTLTNEYRMRWGCDEQGEQWVTVENTKGACQSVMTYDTYLQMEGFLPPATFAEANTMTRRRTTL